MSALAIPASLWAEEIRGAHDAAAIPQPGHMG